jgi:phosphoribosylformimino-5-aminoimidazole carboxamide ribotide isomerase
LDIVAALLDFYPFTQLYIADLNAIQKSATTHYKVIESIAKRFPKLTLWVDAGIFDNTKLSTWQQLNVRLIIGTENFASLSNYCSLNHRGNDFILSLDFFSEGYQGPAELLADTQYWPHDVIVMSLSSVGANQGLNVELLRQIKVRATGFNLIAAGGIRDADDLVQLKNMDIHSALIATALHNKQISMK